MNKKAILIIFAGAAGLYILSKLKGKSGTTYTPAAIGASGKPGTTGTAFNFPQGSIWGSDNTAQKVSAIAGAAQTGVNFLGKLFSAADSTTPTDNTSFSSQITNDNYWQTFSDTQQTNFDALDYSRDFSLGADFQPATDFQMTTYEIPEYFSN